MKLKVHKFIMLPLGKYHFFLIKLLSKFGLLAMMEQEDGIHIFINPQSACNHFGLQTTLLVLEVQEMMCY